MNKWADSGAIDKKRIHEIIKVYENTPESFKIRHKVVFTKKGIFDSMKISVMRAKK